MNELAVGVVCHLSKASCFGRSNPCENEQFAARRKPKFGRILFHFMQNSNTSYRIITERMCFEEVKITFTVDGIRDEAGLALFTR